MQYLQKRISRVGSKKQRLSFQIKISDLTIFVNRSVIVCVRIVRGDGLGSSYSTEQAEIDHVTWGYEKHQVKFKAEPYRKVSTFFLERDKVGRVTGINSKKAQFQILSITNNAITSKQIVDVISSFEVELSDFVFARRYADPTTVKSTGARGGPTSSINTYKMRDAFQSEITFEFMICEDEKPQKRKSVLFAEEQEQTPLSVMQAKQNISDGASGSNQLQRGLQLDSVQNQKLQDLMDDPVSHQDKLTLDQMHKELSEQITTEIILTQEQITALLRENSALRNQNDDLKQVIREILPRIGNENEQQYVQRESREVLVEPVSASELTPSNSSSDYQSDGNQPDGTFNNISQLEKQYQQQKQSEAQSQHMQQNPEERKS